MKIEKVIFFHKIKKLATTGNVRDPIAKQLATTIQHSTWVPLFTVRGIKTHARDHFFFSSSMITYPSKGRKVKQTPGLETYFSDYLPPVTQQPPFEAQAAPSIFEANLAAVTEAKGTKRFCKIANFYSRTRT